MRHLEESDSRIRELMSENSKMAGQMGAIDKYMDECLVPKVVKRSKRVKLLTILYRQALAENERLRLLLSEDVEDET